MTAEILLVSIKSRDVVIAFILFRWIDSCL